MGNLFEIVGTAALILLAIPGLIDPSVHPWEMRGLAATGFLAVVGRMFVTSREKRTAESKHAAEVERSTEEARGLRVELRALAGTRTGAPAERSMSLVDLGEVLAREVRLLCLPPGWNEAGAAEAVDAFKTRFAQEAAVAREEFAARGFRDPKLDQALESPVDYAALDTIWRTFGRFAHRLDIEINGPMEY